jgi:dolichol-phosphate mannosyltransferase
MGVSPVDAAQVTAAAVVLLRLSRGRRRHPPLRPPACAPGARVTVLVPARDEESRIAPCLAALRDDRDAGEVIVIDDCSVDGTAALAASLGARVLPGREPPPGWVGKSWALQQGLEAAHGEVVIWLDADTHPRPGLLGALVAVLEHSDLVSVGPRFDCRGAGERLLHPSMLASLVYRFGPGDSRSHRPRVGRLIANGQCMAARRSPLLAAGGFRDAAGHFTDDAALARARARDGWRVVFRDGAALLDVRMHASAMEVWREWGRTIGFADVSSRPALAADVALVWLTMALPVARLAGRAARPLDRLLLAARWGLLAGMRGSYARRGVAYWLSPLADPVTAVRLTVSALRQPRAWRGRRYESVGRSAP